MKKILFLQIKGNSLGGIWFVNKTLGEEFIKRNYEVRVLGLRNNHPGVDIKSEIKIDVINKNDKWEIVHKRDVINKLFKKGFMKIFMNYFSDKKKLNVDYQKMKKYIIKYDPDYIFASHYQVLYAVPKNYLNKIMFVQHSSFGYLLKDHNNVNLLKKLNNNIHGFYWLSKSTYNNAIKFGYKKNNYIYNPIRFSTPKRADVVSNKKISVITRIHSEKRIDLMIDMVNDVFKDAKFKDWSFDIYGIGEFNDKSKEIMNHNKQINYKGLTDDPENVLLSSSLTLNTSLYEGFSLSIIEAFECGIPVIAFKFGEAAEEQIINDYNGYIVSNINEFKEKLKFILSNVEKLEHLSIGAKEFSGKFEINKIADQWENVFKEIDKECNNAKSKRNSTSL